MLHDALASLGVNESTVRADLRKNPAKDARKSRTETTDDEREKQAKANDYPEPNGKGCQSKAEAIRQKNAEIAAKRVEVPPSKFETIVIDPPWPMRDPLDSCKLIAYMLA